MARWQVQRRPDLGVAAETGLLDAFSGCSECFLLVRAVTAVTTHILALVGAASPESTVAPGMAGQAGRVARFRGRRPAGPLADIRGRARGSHLVVTAGAVATGAGISTPTRNAAVQGVENRMYRAVRTLGVAAETTQFRPIVPGVGRTGQHAQKQGECQADTAHAVTARRNRCRHRTCPG